MLLHNHPHNPDSRSNNFVYDKSLLSGNLLSEKNSEPVNKWGLETIGIDLLSLANHAGGDVLAFFELFEARCKDALRDEVELVEVYGLANVTKALKSSSEKELKEEIITRIDDIRRMGELWLPVFNISIVEEFLSPQYLS